MPLYLYLSQDSMKEHSVYASMAERPPIGHTLEIDGETYIRVVGSQQRIARKDVHFTAMQVPRDWKYAKNFNDQGQPQFSSKRELHEAMSRANDNGEHVTWGHLEFETDRESGARKHTRELNEKLKASGLDQIELPD